MSNLRIWRGIPPGSRLEIAVVAVPKDAPRNFIARARVISGPGQEQILTDQQLAGPQPAIVLLQPLHGYVVRIAASFGGSKGSGEVRALVRKPDNSIYGLPYRYQFNNNTQPDPVRATLVLAMAGFEGR